MKTYQLEVTRDRTPETWEPYGETFPTLAAALHRFHKIERLTWAFANVRILIDGAFTGIIAREE